MKIFRNIILLVAFSFLNLGAGIFADKLHARKQRLGHHKNRAILSNDLSLESRVAFLNRRVGIYRSPSLFNVEFVGLNSTYLFLELKNLNNRLYDVEVLYSVNLYFESCDFTEESVFELLTILTTNKVGIVKFFNCSMQDDFEKILPYIKEAGLYEKEDLDFYSDEDLEDDIRDFFELLNTPDFPLVLTLYN